MRKLKNLVGGAVVAFVLSLALASCSDITLGDVATSSAVNLEAEETSEAGETHVRTLQITLNKSNFNSYKNILPKDWTDGNSDLDDGDLAGNLFYAISGFTVFDDTNSDWKKANGEVTYTDANTPSHEYTTFTYKQLMVSENNSEKAIISLAPLVWRFHLVAYATAVTGDTTIENTDPVLEGWANVDLTEGSNTLNFKLLPVLGTYSAGNATTQAKGTDAKGTTSLKLTFTPPDTFKTITYGVYKESTETSDAPDYTKAAMDETNTPAVTTVTTLTVNKTTETVHNDETDEDEEVTTVTLQKGTEDVVTATKSSVSESGYSYTYALPITYTLNAGTYWFRAVFFDEEGKRIAVHTEKLIINGSNESNNDSIVLTYDAFNKAPKSISNLQLVYKFNGTEFTSNPGYAANQEWKEEDTVLNKYDAIFRWKDNADNEAGYKISIQKEGESTADIITDTTTDNTLLAKYGLTDATSLAAGSTTTTLQLETGTTYKVSIKAYNDWSVDDTATPKTKGFDEFVKYTPRNSTETDADNESFGLFTIDYNINGAVIYKTGSVTTEAAVKHYIVPYIYMNTENTLIGTENTPYIKRSGFDFVGWNELYSDSSVAITNNTKTYYNTVNLATDGTITLPTTGGSRVNSFVNPVVSDDAISAADIRMDATVNDSIATYAWTKTVYSKNGKDFYKEAACTNKVELPDYLLVRPAREDIPAKYADSDDSTKGIACTYSNIMLGGGSVDVENSKNRTLFASWVTDVAINVTVPSYNDANIKLTKEANSGESLAYNRGSKITVNASDKLTHVEFTIYKLNGDASDELFADSDKVTDGVEVDGNKLTWDTSDTPASATAQTYYVKVTGTYTFSGTDNSLDGTTTKIEGWISIKLSN